MSWHPTINSTLVYEVCIGTFCFILNTAKLVDHNYIATVNNTFSYFIFKLYYLSLLSVFDSKVLDMIACLYVA